MVINFRAREISRGALTRIPTLIKKKNTKTSRYFIAANCGVVTKQHTI
jgi:hypothetical protein